MYVFIYCLFNDPVSILDHIGSNVFNIINNALERLERNCRNSVRGIFLAFSWIR
jgi:hypothetical protein